MEERDDGERKPGRDWNENVIDVGWDAKEIERGIRKVVEDRVISPRVARRRNVYGDGHASERIVGVPDRIAQDGGLSPWKRFWDG